MSANDNGPDFSKENGVWHAPTDRRATEANSGSVRFEPVQSGAVGSGSMQGEAGLDSGLPTYPSTNGIRSKVMSDRLDLYHPDVVEAFAAAWASIDGKLDLFNETKDMSQGHPFNGGQYDGYMAEADELLHRAAKRLLAGMDLWDLLTPTLPNTQGKA